MTLLLSIEGGSKLHCHHNPFGDRERESSSVSLFYIHISIFLGCYVRSSVYLQSNPVLLMGIFSQCDSVNLCVLGCLRDVFKPADSRRCHVFRVRSVRLPRPAVNLSIHGMNGKPQCRKHIFTSSHFCSLSRSLHSRRRPQCHPWLLSLSPSQVVSLGIVVFFLLLQFNSIQEAQKAATSRIDWTYQLNRCVQSPCRVMTSGLTHDDEANKKTW